MILYHFTDPWQLWGADWKSHYDPETGLLRITKPDLLPSNRQFDREGYPARLRAPLVWLTTSTKTKPAEHPDMTCLRLKLHLPSTDPRLMSYRKLMRGFLQEAYYPPGTREKVERQWWYRGVIPANRVIEAELLRGQRPWWDDDADASAEE